MRLSKRSPTQQSHRSKRSTQRQQSHPKAAIDTKKATATVADSVASARGVIPPTLVLLLMFAIGGGGMYAGNEGEGALGGTLGGALGAGVMANPS